MRSSSTFTRITRTLAAAAVLGLATPAAWADEQSAFGGLLRLTPDQAGDREARPLPARFSATARKDWGAFMVKNLLTNETFNMPVYPHYPPAPGVQPALLASLENDGRNVIAPVDLTGRGVSDLLLGRKDWGGWRVYTNGQALSRPFDGFVEGFCEGGGEETLKSQLLAMDLSDLEVDQNLMTAAGDFLGNGTEQLAYFRPGWGAIQVIGAHGKVAIEADLGGIPADREGDRQNFLFAFKGRAGERTRLAYHRRGGDKLLVFTSDGHRFTRTVEDARPLWNQLNQFNPNPL